MVTLKSGEEDVHSHNSLLPMKCSHISVMFWSETALEHVPVTMTEQIYIDLIIRLAVQPIREEKGINFVIMDENVRPHRIQTVRVILR